MSAKEFRVIIAGSRNFDDYPLLERTMDRLLSQIKGPIAIVSGTARGADQLGEDYAAERGYPVIRHPAQWNIYGKQAGYLRNETMAKMLMLWSPFGTARAEALAT